jgi:hypothetical protein
LATELQSFYLEQNRVFKAGLNSAVKRRKTPCMLQHGIMEQDQVGSRAYFVLVFSREQIESNKFTQPVMIDRDCRGVTRPADGQEGRGAGITDELVIAGHRGASLGGTLDPERCTSRRAFGTR